MNWCSATHFNSLLSSLPGLAQVAHIYKPCVLSLFPCRCKWREYWRDLSSSALNQWFRQWSLLWLYGAAWTRRGRGLVFLDLFWSWYVACFLIGSSQWSEHGDAEVNGVAHTCCPSVWTIGVCSFASISQLVYHWSKSLKPSENLCEEKASKTTVQRNNCQKRTNIIKETKVCVHNIM